MSQANAAPTPCHRLIVARLVVDDSRSVSEVAARFQVSWPTLKRWGDRYRAGESMQDRSSRPHRSPNKTRQKTARRCINLRLRLREEPVQLVCRLGIAPSTVHRIMVYAHLNRLSHVDRATSEPVRRYKHDHPGVILHVDVKKLGNIPDGGGRRYVGRQQGNKKRAATTGKPKNKYSDPLMGKAFVHAVIDDHSCVTYAEIDDDETALTATAVLVRAVRRPTAKSNASTAPWPTAGPMHAVTPPKPNDAARSTAGCTTTTITVPIRPAGTSRPSHD